MRITVTEKGGTPQNIELKKSEITIGRIKNNDVVLAKGNVNKEHAKIIVESGAVVLYDLRSTNGVYVNGSRVVERQLIAPGDKIYIADFLLTIESDDAPVEASSYTPPEPSWYEFAPRLRGWLIACGVLMVTVIFFLATIERKEPHDGRQVLAGFSMIAFLLLLIPLWRRWRALRFWSELGAKVQLFYRGATALRIVFQPKHDVVFPGFYALCAPSFITKHAKCRSAKQLLASASHGGAQLLALEELSLRANEKTEVEFYFAPPASSGGLDEIALFFLPTKQPPLGVSFHLAKSAGVASPRGALFAPTSAPQEDATGDYREARPTPKHVVDAPPQDTARMLGGLLHHLRLYRLGAPALTLAFCLMLSLLGSEPYKLSYLYLSVPLAVLSYQDKIMSQC